MVVNPFEYVKKNRTAKTTTDTITTPQSSPNVSAWGIEIKKDITIPENKDPKTQNAILEGLEKTKNDDIYYDKAKKQYYVWNEEKQKFVKNKHIKNILETGYCETKDGSYLDNQGNLVIKKEKERYILQNQKNNDLRTELSKVYGFTSTKNKNLFFDKTSKIYLEWDESSQKFEKTNISNVSENGYFQIGNEYYNNFKNKISKKEYIANEKNYIPTNIANVYYEDQNYQKLLQWNEEKGVFEPYGPEADMEELLKQKSDGKLGNIEQGRIGDCWLIASAKGLFDKNPELFGKVLQIDANGNTTVNLKGVNKTYQFTSKDIDEAIKNKKYATGDRDMIAIELAFEKFRKDSIKEQKNTPRNPLGLYYMGVEGYYESMNSYLDGGTPRNAIEVLTGKKVTSLTKTGDSNIIYEDNVAKLETLDEKYLKKYYDDPNKLILISMDISKEKYREEKHGFIFKSYDENNIYLIDPNDTSKIVTKKKEEFYKRLLRVDYTDLNSPINPKISTPTYIKTIETKEVKKYKENQN